MDHEVFTSQMRAALRMLRAALEACPDPLWDRQEDRNRTWHIAYHTLFYAHLYLSPSEQDFAPWDQARPNHQFLGPFPWPPHEVPEIGEPYSREALLGYGDWISQEAARLVAAVPLDAPSGFEWLPFRRAELHLYNVRHVQHHTGQLTERIRQAGGDAAPWVGRDPAEDAGA